MVRGETGSGDAASVRGGWDQFQESSGFVEIFDLFFGQRPRLRAVAEFIEVDDVFDHLAGLFVFDFDDVTRLGRWLVEILIDSGHRDHLL